MVTWSPSIGGTMSGLMKVLLPFMNILEQQILCQHGKWYANDKDLAIPIENYFLVIVGIK